MRKVKNRAIIRNIADKGFRANKTRNFIAVLAIALTTLLFTSLFTIGLGTAENFQRQTMRQSGGDSHGVIKDVSWEQYEKLKEHPSIKECAPCILVADMIKNPEFLKRHVEAWYYPKYHYEHCFMEIMDGRAPEKADEILLDETSLQLMGKEPKAGQKVTLQMQIKQSSEAVTERTFTVSGVLKADSAMNVGFAIVSEAYLTEHANELVYTFPEDSSPTGAIRMDVNFSNSMGIQKKLDQVILDSGYSITEGDSNYIASNANWAYVSDGAEGDSLTIGAVIGALILILLTGYLIIYNVFQISVMKDIRYYGLLKTVGTTGKQIRKILSRQALKMAFYGIPAGLLMGFFIGRAIVPMFMNISSFEGEHVAVSLNPFIFLGAAAFALVTISISIRKPAKMASRVSPVEAVRYTEGMEWNHKKKTQKIRQKKSTDGGKIYRMAFSNLARNKRKTTVVIVSLSLAVVLLNSVFTVTNAFDMDTYLKKFVSSDFLIGNAKYFGLDHYWGRSEENADEENLTESFIAACEAQEGFEDGGRIYSTGTVGLDADSWKMPEELKKNENGEYCPWYTNEPMEPDENGVIWEVMLYGMERFTLGEAEVYEGESDLDELWEKLSTGKYIVSAVSVDDNDKVETEWIKHHAGDKITLVMEDGSKREFEILAVIKENYYGLTNRVLSEFSYYTTADVFKEMASEKFLMSYAFNVEDEKEAAFSEFVERYTTQQEPLMGYESKQIWLKDFSSLTDLFMLVGGVLTLVIAMIGILNFINSILTGIVTRQKEFAMMEAIGMSRRQLVRMLIYEGLYYAGITIAASLVLGCLFSLTAVRSLSEGMWFMKYHFVIWPMFPVFPVLLVLGVVVPVLAYRPQSKQSLVEAIRSNE